MRCYVVWLYRIENAWHVELAGMHINGEFRTSCLLLVRNKDLLSM